MRRGVQLVLLALLLGVVACSAAVPEDDACWQQRFGSLRRQGRTQLPCVREGAMAQSVGFTAADADDWTPVPAKAELAAGERVAAAQSSGGGQQPSGARRGRAPPAI